MLMWGVSVCVHIEARDQHGGLPHCRGRVMLVWCGCVCSHVEIRDQHRGLPHCRS